MIDRLALLDWRAPPPTPAARFRVVWCSLAEPDLWESHLAAYPDYSEACADYERLRRAGAEVCLLVDLAAARRSPDLGSPSGRYRHDQT